jgi:hypothetical protein
MIDPILRREGLIKNWINHQIFSIPKILKFVQMEYLTNYLFNEIKSSTFKLYLFYIYIKLKIIFEEKILFEKIIINILVFFL